MQTSSYNLASFWQQSDDVIRVVAIILLVMSASSWFIILVRSWKLLYLRHLARFTMQFWHTQSYAEGLRILDNRYHDNPFFLLAAEAQTAVEHHAQQQSDLHGLLPLTEWLNGCLRNSIDETVEKLQRGLGILASVGSTSPFIGLFGTVWGIYHALANISASGQTSVSAVAGPVGEALVMTAFGLVVAIPAVLGYNAINRGNRNIFNRLNRFSHQLHAYFVTGAMPHQNRQAFNATSIPVKTSSAELTTSIEVH